MKNKDFGFFQQHAEKIALGLGLLVLLAVGVSQFVLGEPNAVEINNQPVAPGEIRETVVREAQRLDQSLKRDSPVEPREIPKYAESFVNLYTLPVASDRTLNPIDQVGLADTWVKVVQPSYAKKILPDVPLATDVFVKNGHGVLADIQDQQVINLREMIGNEQPADFPYVSVSAKFSFAEWVNRLRSSDIPAVNRVEEGLWADRLAITGVQLLREELDPETGKWGNPTEIDPLPGQYALLPGAVASAGGLRAEDAEQLEQQVMQSQPLIRRTPFPPISNGAWVPPSAGDRVLTAEDLRRQQEIQDRITRLERQLERMSQQGNPDARRNAPVEDFYDDPAAYDDGASSRRDRRSRNNDRGRQPAEQQDPEARRLERMNEELDAARREMDELLGIDPDSTTTVSGGQGYDPSMDDPGNFGGPELPRRGNRFQDYNNPGFQSNNQAGSDVPETVTVWAHDLTIEPGKTYRYKVKVFVLNPLFRNPRLDAEQLKENRNRIALGPSAEQLEAAGWSAPVAIDREHYFFVTSGNRDQKRADFEVWTVYNGVWRTQEFTEYPGNEIGDTAELEEVNGRVPMNVGSIMLDVDSVSNPNGGGSVVRVLYLDGQSNQIRTRLVQEDKISTDRTRLQIDRDRQTQAQQNTQLGQGY